MQRARNVVTQSTDPFLDVVAATSLSHVTVTGLVESPHKCPYPNTHRRLLDVHDLWHECAESYMDPRAFRRKLNSILAEIRNVSFVMQKEGRDNDPKFSSWYQTWVEEISKLPLMTWAKNSRNRVVKEGDLDLLSQCRVTLRASWTLAHDFEMNVPPAASLLEIAQIARQASQGKAELIIVTRQWVDVKMPGTELLGALAEAFRACSNLVRLAHQQAGVSCNCSDVSPETDCELDLDQASNPPCMTRIKMHLSVAVNAKGGVYQENVTRVHSSPEAFGLAKERYGELPSLAGLQSALDAVEPYVQMGKAILRVDEDLLPVSVFFGKSGIVDMIPVEVVDKSSSYLRMTRLAERAALPDVDSFLISADAWFAPPGGTRGSALTVQAISRAGDLRSAIVPYTRDASGTHFEDRATHTVVWNDLEPFRLAWGIDAWRVREDF